MTNADDWTITCRCGEAVLQAHGQPIHVAICHGSDCRMAQGREAPTERLALASLGNDGLPRYQTNPEDPHLAALIQGCS